MALQGKSSYLIFFFLACLLNCYILVKLVGKSCLSNVCCVSKLTMGQSPVGPEKGAIGFD